MRDPKRIHKVMTELELFWKEVPDWRFGQLMCNITQYLYNKTKRDPFFIEDDEMAEFLASLRNHKE